ncbi:MAG: GAF domain-containing protein [Oscillochloris sp.]|nr:GAF domain-containing protein [Oscillochloris sp.]
MSSRDDLDTRPTAELAQMVRELQHINGQLRARLNPNPPHAAQALLDDQFRRTALLTQLAIEFRENLDQQTAVTQTLRAVMAHLQLTGASVILTGSEGPELALSMLDGQVDTLDAALAGEVITNGLAGWVLRHGSSVALSDVARDRRWLQFSERHRSGSVIVVPIRQANATAGVLTVHRGQPNAFSSHDLILLEGVAAQLGVALGAARYQLGERQRRDQALALLSMSQFLSTEHDLIELAAMLQEKSATVFNAQHGLLYLEPSDPIEQGLQAILPPTRLPSAELLKQCAGAAQLAFEGRRIVTTAPANGLTCVALPLAHHGKTIGAFVQLYSGNAGFPASVWSLLTIFTNVVASACASMRLVSRLTEQTRLLEDLVEQRTHQLQRSRDVLRVVFDSLPDGVLLIDGEEHLVAANHIFCRQIVVRTHGNWWAIVMPRSGRCWSGGPGFRLIWSITICKAGSGCLSYVRVRMKCAATLWSAYR